MRRSHIGGAHAIRSHGVVSLAARRRVLRHVPGTPSRHVGEADDGLIADGGDASQRHAAGALDGPFVVLLEQDGAYQTNDGRLVGEDPDDLCPALHLAVQALEGVDRVQLRPVLRRDAHIGQHVGLGVVHQRGELGAGLVGDAAPLLAGGLRVMSRAKAVAMKAETTRRPPAAARLGGATGELGHHRGHDLERTPTDLDRMRRRWRRWRSRLG
jgi:hypothetical protein